MFPTYLLLVSFKLITVISAIALTTTFSPASAGSGVPQLRAILSGMWIRGYLGLTTFAIKVISLTLGLASGLPIGLEGPFIHISAIMGRQLMRVIVSNVFSSLSPFLLFLFCFLFFYFRQLKQT